MSLYQHIYNISLVVSYKIGCLIFKIVFWQEIHGKTFIIGTKIAINLWINYLNSGTDTKQDFNTL